MIFCYNHMGYLERSVLNPIFQEWIISNMLFLLYSMVESIFCYTIWIIHKDGLFHA